MKKYIYALGAAILFVCCTTNFTFAQAKKVLYITEQKTLDISLTTGTSNDPIANDPIIRLLKADPNLSVTVKVLSAADADVADFPIPEMATHDVLVIQESIGGGRNILKPGGTLALTNLTKPTLYNKIHAFSNNRAVGGNGNSLDASTATTRVLSIVVPREHKGNLLYAGLPFSPNPEDVTVGLFLEGATDAGGDSGTGIAKALSYNNDVVMDPPPITPLATFPTNGTLSISNTGTPVFFTDVPANTTLRGSTASTGYTLPQRVIFFGMNFGAIGCTTKCTNFG